MTRSRKTAGQPPPAQAQTDAEDSFLQAFLADWNENDGRAAIASLRKEKPADYVRIAATIFAKQAEQKVDPLHELTDAELVDRIERLAASIGLDVRVRASPRGVGKADQGSATER